MSVSRCGGPGHAFSELSVAGPSKSKVPRGGVNVDDDPGGVPAFLVSPEPGWHCGSSQHAQGAQEAAQFRLDGARRANALDVQANGQLLRRSGLVVVGPMLAQGSQACPRGRPMLSAARQVAEQKSLVVGLLPDEMVDAVFGSQGRCRRILLRGAAVDEDGLDGEVARRRWRLAIRSIARCTSARGSPAPGCSIS